MFKGKKHSKETKQRISKTKKGKPFPGIIFNWKGRKFTEEHKRKISEANKGKKHGIMSKKTKEKISLALTGKNRSNETKQKISFAHKGKPKLYLRGAKSHFWKGGITPINAKIRTSLEYRLWREAVFKRDNWTCVWCLKRGVKLNADHIKPFCDYPELRFDINNGRTLCVPCHRTTETYKRKMTEMSIN